MTSLIAERNALGVISPGVINITPTQGIISNIMIPRCAIRIERANNGCKIQCIGSDPTACSLIQNICGSMSSGIISGCITLNGICICNINMTCGLCKCEQIKDGICINWISGDQQCCKMIQQCCDCIQNMIQSGCCCNICINGSPICCAVI